MWNYTEDRWGEILRGSRWPPAPDPFRIEIENTDGWDDDSDEWLWEIVLSRTLRGGTPDLVLTAAATLAGDVLTLRFHATHVETAALPGKARQKFFIDVRSDDRPQGTTTTTSGAVYHGRSYYDQVQGYAWVRNVAGEG